MLRGIPLEGCPHAAQNKEQKAYTNRNTRLSGSNSTHMCMWACLHAPLEFPGQRCQWGQEARIRKDQDISWDARTENWYSKGVGSVFEVSDHTPSRATLKIKLRRLPVIFPLASKGGCQLTMTPRGFPSRVMTVRSLGAEVGAARGTETRPCHWMWKNTDIYGTSHRGVDTQNLSCSLSRLFYHLQFLSSTWVK